MKKIDYHMHSTFSPDSKCSPEEHIQAAINKGLTEICFTDHNDFFVSHDKWVLDVEHYFETLQSLKEKYKDYITIKIGIEVGLDLMFKSQIESLISKYPFDFVIGSIHCIQSVDVATALHRGKTKLEYHTAYFDAMKACVEQFDCFDVLGHLDYPRRYGPYENKDIDETYFQSIIDDIFRTLIKKGKGIEINCSGYRMFGVGLPNTKQVTRFKELGGQYVTVGTDAHYSEHTGLHVEQAIELCEQLHLPVATFTARIQD